MKSGRAQRRRVAPRAAGRAGRDGSRRPYGKTRGGGGGGGGGARRQEAGRCPGRWTGRWTGEGAPSSSSWPSSWPSPTSAAPGVAARASSRGGSPGDAGEARRHKLAGGLRRLAKALRQWGEEVYEDLKRWAWIKDSEFGISERARGVARWSSSTFDGLDRRWALRMKAKRASRAIADNAPRLLRELRSFSKTPLGSVAGVMIFVYLVSTGLLFRILNVLFILTWILTLAAPFFLRPLVERLQQQQMEQMEQMQQQQQGRTRQQGQGQYYGRGPAGQSPFGSNGGQSKRPRDGGDGDGGGIIIDADWEEID